MRRFISGMGVGILVATLVLAVTYIVKGNHISDSEVIRRAKQLGMVESKQSVIKEVGNDDENVSGDSVATSQAASEDIGIEQPVEVQSDSGMQPDVDTQPDADAQSETDTQDDDNAQTKTDTQESTQTQQDVEVQTIADVVDNSGDTSADDTVQVTIPKGMDGVTVSFLLKERGVVDDAMDFNKYLSDHKLQGDIIYGTYELKKNSSYEEIEKQIIRK